MLKFGRNRPIEPPQLHFRQYRLKALSAPPATFDASRGQCGTGLSRVLCNDNLGCCVIAGNYHILVVWTQDSFIATDQEIIKDYSAIGGYVIGNPHTDNGCDEQTAFKYWMTKGYADGGKLCGFLGVDARNTTLLKQGLCLFENLYFGISLPNAYVNPMPSKSGFVWDVAGKPNPNQGHCIIGYGYNSKGILIDSWGMRGLLTWAAAAKYMLTTAGGEAYILISQDMLMKAQTKAANGLNWNQLISDFSILGG